LHHRCLYSAVFCTKHFVWRKRYLECFHTLQDRTVIVRSPSLLRHHHKSHSPPTYLNIVNISQQASSHIIQPSFSITFIHPICSSTGLHSIAPFTPHSPASPSDLLRHTNTRYPRFHLVLPKTTRDLLRQLVSRIISLLLPSYSNSSCICFDHSDGFFIATHPHPTPIYPTSLSSPIPLSPTLTFTSPSPLLMLDYSESPPPLLHSPVASERALPTSRESTPLTPVAYGPSTARRPDKDRAKDSHLPWFKKPIDIGSATTSLFLDSSLLEPDFDDHSFPLFGAEPPARSMADAATPIDITPRQSSNSPRGPQSSNLTSALQRVPEVESSRLPPFAPSHHTLDTEDGGKSVTMADGTSLSHSGAKPISVKASSKEPIPQGSVAQSVTTGMSWGGISVGSWIRDE
jgi:hypothetical protein